MQLLVLFLTLIACIAGYRRYDGYKVFQINIENDEKAAIIRELEDSQDYDFWSELHRGEGNDIMVAPKAQEIFKELLIKNNIPYEVIIEDVEPIFEAERDHQARNRIAPNGRISFTTYHRYDVIEAYLRQLEADYPDIVSLETAAYSLEGRNLTAIKISTGADTRKPIFFIDAGIHAREWIAPATALYLIQELVENPANRRLIETVDWHIIPLVNPDGYEYSHTNTRLWRKTRRPSILCAGVDANRNFDSSWAGAGASTFPCSETYAGPSPFSEPEAGGIRDWTAKYRDRIIAYVSVHSYGNYILYPWGYTNALPDNWVVQHNLALASGRAIQALFGTTYTIGSSSATLYPAAGVSTDYVHEQGVPISYTFELPGGGSAGFDLPPSRIVDVATETYQAFVERMWRKTRRPGSSCYGVDGNRNYDSFWSGPGSSSNQCSQTYHGPSVFSEPEIQGIREWLNTYKERIGVFVSIHSYGNYILYPWGWKTDLPDNFVLQHNLGLAGGRAIEAVFGTTYRIGTTIGILYAAAGVAADYAYDIGVPISYTLELPGGGSAGFDLPPARIADVERLWRKTRRPGASCYGVDGNRNYDSHWLGPGASSNECSNTYAGPAPFSEPEIRGIADWVDRYEDDIGIYISIHSYGNYILYPFGYTSSLPDNWVIHHNLGIAAGRAIAGIFGTAYSIGTFDALLYPATGVSADYIKELGVDYSYTIELPGGGSAGFDLPPGRIDDVVTETLEDRMWRKTRRAGTLCDGVDANRNYDSHWSSIGASADECSQTYAGPYPFSESEARGIANWLETYQDRIKTYITLHSYGNLFLYPWGYTFDMPDNYVIHHNLALAAVRAITAFSGTTYTIGSSANVLYTSSGTSRDYAKEFGIPLSYTIEQPGGGNAGFDLPAERIVPVVTETYEAFIVIHDFLEIWDV